MNKEFEKQEFEKFINRLISIINGEVKPISEEKRNMLIDLLNDMLKRND